MRYRIFLPPEVAQGREVVLVNGHCYEELGPSSVPPDVLEVEDTFENCEECDDRNDGSTSPDSSSGPDECFPCDYQICYIINGKEYPADGLSKGPDPSPLQCQHHTCDQESLVIVPSGTCSEITHPETGRMVASVQVGVGLECLIGDTPFPVGVGSATALLDTCANPNASASVLIPVMEELPLPGSPPSQICTIPATVFSKGPNP